MGNLHARPSRHPRSALAGVTAGLLMAGSCGLLGTPEPDVCGNHVVEPDAGEDCDGSAACLTAADPAPCSLECRDADCPQGWECGLDQVCRRPSFEFELGPLLPGNAAPFWLAVEDFDGDGRDDVAGAWGSVTGEGEFFVSYLDASRDEAARWEWPGIGDVPIVGDVDGDGHPDVLHRSASGDSSGTGSSTRNDVLVQLGGETGRLRPAVVGYGFETRPRATSVVSDPLSQVLFVHADAVVSRPPLSSSDPGGGDFEVLAEPDMLGALSPDHEGCGSPSVAGQTGALIELPWGDGDGDGDGDGSGFGYERENGPIRLFTTCAGDLWEEEFDVTPPPSLATQRRWVGFADANADGRADLLVYGRPTGADASTRALHVAYRTSDGFHSDAMTIDSAPSDFAFDDDALASWTSSAVEDGAQIRIGDFDGDRALDVVFQRSNHRILLSSCWGVGTSCEIALDFENRLDLGTAVVGDVDGDGRDDLVGRGTGGALPASDVVVARSTGDGFAVFTIPTDDFVGDVDLADFDGDGRADIVVTLGFLEDPTTGIGIAVAYGRNIEDGLLPVIQDSPVAPPGLAPIAVDVSGAPELGFVATVGIGDATSGSETEYGVAHFWRDRRGRFVAPGFRRGAATHALAAGRFGTGGAAELLVAESVSLSAFATVEARRLQRLTTDSEVLRDETIDLPGPWDEAVLPSEFAQTMLLSPIDVDGDGRDELLFTGTTGVTRPLGTGITSVLTLVQRDEGGWTTRELLNTPDLGLLSDRWQAQAVDLRAMDVDGDGDEDLHGFIPIPERIPDTQPFAQTQGGGWLYVGGESDDLSRRVPVVIENVDGSLVPRVVPAPARSDVACVLGPTGDGRVAVATADADAVRVLAWDPSDDSTTTLSTAPVPGRPTACATGDLDGDGLVDLVLGTPLGAATMFGRRGHRDLPDAREDESTRPVVCGDGVREGDEQCDGEDLAGADCSVFGRDGPARCDATCRFDDRECTTGRRTCDPLADGCPEGSACHFFGGDNSFGGPALHAPPGFHCAPSGPLEEGDACNARQLRPDCGDGLDCAGPLFDGVCLRLCDPDDPSACAEGQTCDGSAQPDWWSDPLGVCR